MQWRSMVAKSTIDPIVRRKNPETLFKTSSFLLLSFCGWKNIIQVTWREVNDRFFFFCMHKTTPLISCLPSPTWIIHTTHHLLSTCDADRGSSWSEVSEQMRFGVWECCWKNEKGFSWNTSLIKLALSFRRQADSISLKPLRVVGLWVIVRKAHSLKSMISVHLNDRVNDQIQKTQHNKSLQQPNFTSVCHNVAIFTGNSMQKRLLY